MSGFGHYGQAAQDLEREILRHGVVLGLDWADVTALRLLAREALHCEPGCLLDLLRDKDPVQRSKGELFALADLMLETMRESARIGVHTHGGPAWKAFGRALYEEAASLPPREA